MDATWTGRLRRSAAVGAVLWAGASASGLFVDRASQLVALAPVTIVPLALALATEGEPATLVSALAAGAVVLSGPAALLAVVMRPGPAGAVLAAVWLVATALVGLVGASRLWASRSVRPLHELAVTMGLIYLPVGAVWLLASRSGVALLGFREPIVTFTAAHFHYAGLGAPVVTGVLGRVLTERGEGRSWLYGSSAGVIVLGIPLMAAGIQLGRALEMPAAGLLASGLLVVAGLLARQGGRWLLSPGDGRQRLGGLLVAVSGCALVFSMMLAVLFAATGSATRGASEPMVAYRDMADLHGTANALGFTLPALLGLTLGWRRPRAGTAA